MTKYRALRGLTVPINAREDARIRKAVEDGKPIPYGQRKTVRIEAGEVAEYIPAKSIPWLLEQGHIEVVADSAEEESDGAS